MRKSASMIMASAITAVLTTSVLAFVLANQAFASVMSGSGTASISGRCPPGCIPIFPFGCACYGTPGLALSAGSGAASVKVGTPGLALSAGGASVTFQGGGPHESTGGVVIHVTSLPPISPNTH